MKFFFLPVTQFSERKMMSMTLFHLTRTEQVCEQMEGNAADTLSFELEISKIKAVRCI